MKKIFIYFMFFILKNYSFCFQLNCFDSFKSLYHQSPESDALVYAIQKSILKLNFLSVFLSTSFFCTIIFFLLKNQSEKILNKKVHPQLSQFLDKLNRLEESVNNHKGENKKYEEYYEEYKETLVNLIKNIKIVAPENIELRNFLEKLTKSIGKSNNEDTEKQIFLLQEDIKKVREHINQLDKTMRLHEKINIAPNPVNIQYCEEVNEFSYQYSIYYDFHNKPESDLYLNDFGLERAMNNIIKQNNTSKNQLLSINTRFEEINKIKGEELKCKFDRAFDDAQEWIEGKKKFLDYGNMLDDDNKYKLLFKIFLCNQTTAELNGWKKMIPFLIYNLALYNDDMAYQLKSFFEGGKTINDLENWETLFYFLKFTIDRSNLTNDFLKEIIFKEENYVNTKFKSTLLNHFFLKMFNNHSQINNYQNDGYHKGFRENENYTIDNKLMNKLNFMSCKPFDNFELNDFSHSFNILLETVDQQTFTARSYPAMILSKFDNNRKKNLFKQNNGFWAPANLLFNKNFSDLNQEQKEYFHNYLSFLNQSSNFFDSEDNDFKKFRERILITFGNSDNVGKDNEYPNWENINSINNQLLKNYKDSFLDAIVRADIQLGTHFGKKLTCSFLKRYDGLTESDFQTFKRRLEMGNGQRSFPRIFIWIMV